jgi:magnesium transporter
MLGNLIGPEIRELIEARNFVALREVFADWSPADAAECIRDLPEEEQAVVFRLLPHDQATEVFEYLDRDDQQTVLKAMSNEAAAHILNDMSPDDRTALLEELPAAAVTQMLTLLSPTEREIAQSLLNYPEDSVGRLMTPDYVSVRETWTIQRVLDHIRANGSDSETLNVIYVTDDQGRLIDDVRIREILLRPLDALVSEIHDNHFVALRATDEQETALHLFRKYDRNTLPVVDTEDVQEEETTEDIQKLGGLEALDEPYMDAPLLRLVRKRALWLVVLFLGQMLTATVMGVYKASIESAVVLSLFVPLIISSGGNSGSQAATLIIRAMALGEVTLGDWWRVMGKEILSGLLLGLFLATLGFARIMLGAHFGDEFGTHAIAIGITISISVLGVVLWGTLCGAMLPLILRRCGLDPATSSAPFVATLVDVTGLMIYFGTAVVILKGTVL